MRDEVGISCSRPILPIQQVYLDHHFCQASNALSEQNPETEIFLRAQNVSN